MKNVKYILVVILAIFVYNSCTDDLPGTKDINYISFDDNTQTIIVEKGGSTTYDVNVYTTQTSGSDRTFGVEVIAAGTSANAESYSVPSTVTVPANSNKGTVTVSASDNNLGEDPVSLALKISDTDGLFTGNTVSLAIQKHCALNINDFVGTYSGATAGGWGDTQVVTSLDGNGNLQITGIGVAFMTGYWGEVILSMATLPMNVDLETGDFTIDEAPYFETTYNGAPQPTYYLSASGNLNACSGTMYLYYDFNQAGVGSYVAYFESQAAFTEIIKIQ